jgi:hypothetical protein
LGENTEEAISSLRKGEFPDYDDGTVKGTIEANPDGSKRGRTSEMRHRKKNKKVTMETKSKRIKVPSKIFKEIKACDCECCGHK